MIIFKQAGPLSNHLSILRKEGHSVGFVPTMGALHNGHISLISESAGANSVTVCSIFVNPTQFNNEADFTHYPVTIEKDIQLLIESRCDILFLPSVAEIYPPGYMAPHYDLGTMETTLEGRYRPGHFQGVCQVVDRLLEIVNPSNLYMGQKDFQQCMVIDKLLNLTGRAGKINLRIQPTIREKDGLAMSSRNLRLNKDERQLATAIYRELTSIREHFRKGSFDQLMRKASQDLEQQGFAVDYIQIADAGTLQPASNPDGPLVVLAAATIGSVRLIDNLLLN